MLVEVRVAQHGRLSRKDLLAALATLGTCCQAFGRQPVGGIAVGAYNMFEISHENRCWPVYPDFKVCRC
jgi:hypothetical protein